MKTFKTLLLGLCIVMCACSTQTPRQTNEYGTNWQWENGTIVIETPERPAGQKKRVGTDCPEDGSSTRRIRRTGHARSRCGGTFHAYTGYTSRGTL